MEIPASLKIFSIIYECRLWLIIPLAVVWSVFLFMQLYHRKRKAFFITLAALPLVILPIAVATTWSGWHYRMELRNRYAQIPNMQDAIDIDRMPPAIRSEYAKHDYHPRFSDVKRMILWNILLLPATCLIAVAAWTMYQKNSILTNEQPPEIPIGNSTSH